MYAAQHSQATHSEACCSATQHAQRVPHRSSLHCNRQRQNNTALAAQASLPHARCCCCWSSLQRVMLGAVVIARQLLLLLLPLP
jgi:hypothetical protein